MKKKLTAIILAALMILLTFGLAACGGGNSDDASTEAESSETVVEETKTVNAGAEYGYTGDDAAVAAVYKYLAEEIATQYLLPEDAVSIPVVQIIDEETEDDGDVEIEGVFYIYNYTVEGDTLKMVSGGEHDGKIELRKSGDEYVVEEFEQVADGSDYESSAKDIFDENYKEFSKVVSDYDAREALRAETIANYVKANGLSVTKYQDEGWDPVELKLD